MSDAADTWDDLRAALLDIQDNLDEAYKADTDLRRGAKINEAVHAWDDAWESAHDLAEDILGEAAEESAQTSQTGEEGGER